MWAGADTGGCNRWLSAWPHWLWFHSLNWAPKLCWCLLEHNEGSSAVKILPDWARNLLVWGFFQWVKLHYFIYALPLIGRRVCVTHSCGLSLWMHLQPSCLLLYYPGTSPSNHVTVILASKHLDGNSFNAWRCYSTAMFHVECLIINFR